MYIATYRCKLCKTEFGGEMCNEKEADMRMEFHCYPNHYCRDGSMGVPEFLGMRYVDGSKSE